MNARASLHTAGPAVLVGLLAFLLTVDLRAQQNASAVLTSRRAELSAVVAARQARTNDLEKRQDELRSQVAAAAEGSSQGRLRELQRLNDLLARSSGTTPVSGPGMVVRLADADPSTPQANEGDARIQDVDVQAVVNALWDAGAEAIAVNGQRLVTTSAIRNAGPAVLVNYRVLTSPYRISAIGDPVGMLKRFDESQTARRFRGWAQIYGLGFTSSRADGLDLPAFTGSLQLRHAKPITSGS